MSDDVPSTDCVGVAFIPARRKGGDAMRAPRGSDNSVSGSVSKRKLEFEG